MNFKQTFRFVGLCLLIITCISTDFAFCDFSEYQNAGFEENQSNSLKTINESLKSCLLIRDLDKAAGFVNKLTDLIKNGNEDNPSLADSYYFIAIYYYEICSYKKALSYYSSCIALKEKRGEVDRIYMMSFYNQSLAYSQLGYFKKFELSALKSLEIGKKIYKESGRDMTAAYLSVGSAYLTINEYEKALVNLDSALQIAIKLPDSENSDILTRIYGNLGVCYSQLGDVSKARVYYEKTVMIYDKFMPVNTSDYVNTLSNLAVTLKSLGLRDECAKYYEKGISLTLADNLNTDYNLINNYAIFLSDSKKKEQGEKLLRTALEKAKTRVLTDERSYFEALSNYAGFLRENNIDLSKSLEDFEKCVEYVKANNQDVFLRTRVLRGYSTALEAAGQTGKALETIQLLLYNDDKQHGLENPLLVNLVPDVNTLRNLQIKYKILWDKYTKASEPSVLSAVAETSELIVSLIDKVRINISEEQSRLILGDKYREAYLDVIRDFNLLYSKTGDKKYLETAFEYSEKSKVAGLLASTRELKATQLHIPADIGNLERELQRQINLYDVRIADESSAVKPDKELISGLKENLLGAIRKRDSLITVFEKKYPDYYALKYNTKMVGFKEIPSLIGHDGSYLNYILSDSLLYTFIVNRKYQKLLVQHIDSTFIYDIKKFRNLLSIPSPTENAYGNFKEFQTLGFKLYKTLIEPVKSYLISDRVVISPDNFLSYLPFEAFPTGIDTNEGGIRYKELKYLMYDLDISYTYSATFMAEMAKKKSVAGNNLIAFAPDYPESIDIQSVMLSRQGNMGTLNDLPYARQEAEYVSGITGGKLYENKNAIESVYKTESGNYDIIHLAMHTLLNDKDPMRSTLIFSHAKDTEDGYLKTYEIYGIPLKAKMVVLSSCNTGIGMLYSGEGILSLARGFIYSGSLSVVMSMWEIEDKSGTEVVKMFYDNLEKGYSKSVSLKRARTAFLKDADQLRSHPYFWSSMVIYGNDSALYSNNKLKIAVLVISILLIVASVFYYLRRRYS